MTSKNLALVALSTIFSLALAEGLGHLELKYHLSERLLGSFDPTKKAEPNESLVKQRQELTDFQFQEKAVLEPSGKVIYEQIYKLSSQKFRLVKNHNSHRKDFAALFGCSWVFGTGVSDNGNVPQLLQDRQTKYNIYNFGIQGGAPSDFLDRKSDIEAEATTRIKEESGVFIYQFISHHLLRSFCPFSCYAGEKTWMQKKNKYIKNSEKRFISIGPFDQNWTSWEKLTSLFGKSALIQLAGLRIFDSIGETEYEDFADMVEQIALDFSKVKKIEEKIFVLAMANGQERKLLPAKLEARGFRVIDLSQLDREKELGEQAWIPYDMHPTELANQWYTDLLKKQLAPAN